MSITPTLLIDSGKFRIEYGVTGSVLAVRPVGIMDEDVNFSCVLALVRDLGKAVTLVQFDLGFISALNSCGVREWLLFMERMESQPARCAYINVNEVFIDQANMISNFFGRRANSVLSFQAPYHCTQCNHEAMVLLDPNEIKFVEDHPVPPPSKCPKCAAAMTFDSLEDEYFAFVRRQKESVHVDR